MKKISIIRPLQLLLGGVSFLFNRTVKGLIYPIFIAFRYLNSGSNPMQWVGMSSLLQDSMMKAYIGLAAPRWNCAATLAFINSVKVDSEVSIRFRETTGEYHFYLDIYKERSLVSSFSSLDVSSDSSKPCYSSVALPSGNYRIVYRGYCVDAVSEYPTIAVDDKLVSATLTPMEEYLSYQEILESIREKKSLYAFLLHYYVYLMLLIFGRRFTRFVHNEYLPVGNEETYFKFGAFKSGKKLSIEASEELLANYNVNITLLNACSFPMEWQSLKERNLRFNKLNSSGTYLIRATPRKGKCRLVDETIDAGLAVFVK